MSLGRCVVAFGMVLLGAVSPTDIAAGQASQPCSATLDGEQFPFLIPEFLVWQDVFLRAQTTEQAPEAAGDIEAPRLSAEGIRSLRAIGPLAVQRAGALRSASFKPSGVPPETAAADLVLEGRDDLLRSLTAADAESMAEYLEAKRRATRYTFRQPGRRAASPGAVATCPTTIEGKHYPELIPEAYYWEFYFRVLATMSESHRIGATEYEADFMSALRQGHLPIPVRDVIAVLSAAAEVTPVVDATRAQWSDSRDAERAVAAVIRAARLKLLRSLPRGSWIHVQRHAAENRGGTVYTFPTSS
jgi:hypothetical protein